MLGQVSEVAHGNAEVVSIGDGLAIVAPAKEKRWWVTSGENAAKIPQALEFF